MPQHLSGQNRKSLTFQQVYDLVDCRACYRKAGVPCVNLKGRGKLLGYPHKVRGFDAFDHPGAVKLFAYPEAEVIRPRLSKT